MSSTPEKTPFIYGWCNTDHKEGREIRRDWRPVDYMNDSPYAEEVREILEKLGLPFPEQAQIFRGTRHDLLFLDSHGVVVRVGFNDTKDLINPAILQPLGWLETGLSNFNGFPFTVAVYPGVELYAVYAEEEDSSFAGSVRTILHKSGQGTNDLLTDRNLGVIRVLGSSGETEINVPLVIDIDSMSNGSYYYARTESMFAQKRRETFEQLCGEGLPVGTAMARTLREMFNEVHNANTGNTECWIRAFEMHQPLRDMFWDAVSGEKLESAVVDTGKIQAFWNKCAEALTARPMIEAPHWRPGSISKGEPAFVNEGARQVPLALYRAWTNDPADMKPYPVIPAALRDAVQAAHASEIPAERPAPRPLPQFSHPRTVFF